MIILGLTGSVAMGKSVIGAMMTQMRIPVHEADHEIHGLLKPGSAAYPSIAALFPFFEHPDIYDRKTRILNRKALGDLVFNSDAHRERLESALHPFVQKAQAAFIRAALAKGVDMVCLDIPLLFETGAQERVDYTITASAPWFVQRRRALSRPGMSEEKFHAILKRQMPDAEKCARSDYVIQTGLGRAHTMKALKTVMCEIRSRL